MPVSVDRIDPETKAAASAFLRRVALGFDLDRAYLFGSRARRDHHRESDADVAVVLRGPTGRFVETKLALADIAYDVLLETGVRVQPLPIWEEEWAHPDVYANPDLLRDIQREGLPL